MKMIVTALLLAFCCSASAQSPVGRWKMVSHTIDFNGKKTDTHAALLQQRPCAAGIVYAVNTDGTFRLDAAGSGCDERYRNVQEKLWSKTRWKLEGNKITTSATNFAVGQTYTVAYTGSRMTWTGTEGQGIIVYQKL